MKVTIDTKEDSKEEIKKVIQMLTSVVGSSYPGSSGDVFSNDTSDFSPGIQEEPASEQETSQNAFSAMFGNNAEPPAEKEETAEEKPEEEPEEEKDEQVEIVPY